jgi:hypothetical protein
MPTSAAATSQDWSMTSQLKTASIMPTLNATEPSQVVAFAWYATAQVAFHERVVTLHQVDGTGCCRCCGRVWPCDQLRHSRRMVDHFGQWALTDEPDPVPDAALVRPYVGEA